MSVKWLRGYGGDGLNSLFRFINVDSIECFEHHQFGTKHVVSARVGTGECSELLMLAEYSSPHIAINATVMLMQDLQSNKFEFTSMPSEDEVKKYFTKAKTEANKHMSVWSKINELEYEADDSNKAIKAIRTEYKGYSFRSRLEARWAVFFDACGVIKWEYEQEGFELPNGMKYLPDFKLYGVQGRAPSTLWVEVKGNMTDDDKKKIEAFADFRVEPTGHPTHPEKECVGNPIMVLGNIPNYEHEDDIFDYFIGKSTDELEFNFRTIDGDYYPAVPYVNKNGMFCINGTDYMNDIDTAATKHAYDLARQARFEHGETPQV